MLSLPDEYVRTCQSKPSCHNFFLFHKYINPIRKLHTSHDHKAVPTKLVSTLLTKGTKGVHVQSAVRRRAFVFSIFEYYNGLNLHSKKILGKKKKQKKKTKEFIETVTNNIDTVKHFTRYMDDKKSPDFKPQFESRGLDLKPASSNQT